VLKFVGRRLLAAIPTIAIVLMIAVVMVELMPGDPARIIAGEWATEEVVEATRERLELDQPVPARFVDFATSAVQGDLGKSYRNHVPVSDLIRRALPVTLWLGFFALTFAVVVGGLGGALAATRRGRLTDRIVSLVSAVALSVPPFVWAFALVVPFALQRSWFPATGYAKMSEGAGEWATHLALPSIALGLALAAELARQTRAALVENFERDFVRTARANGLSRFAIWKHVLRNASITIVTVIGLQSTRVLGGVVVVEFVFALPGFGTLAYLAVLGRDLPLIQGAVVVSGVIVVLINLLVDVSYGYLNPKMRVQS